MRLLYYLHSVQIHKKNVQKCCRYVTFTWVFDVCFLYMT